MARPSDDGALQRERAGDVAVVRLTAAHPVFDHAVDLVADCIRALVEEGTRLLLIDARHPVFPSPSLVERLRMVRQWAQAADGRVRVAMLAPAAYIDPERFGVVAAGNFGLAAQVFVHEAEALAWLHEEHAAELRRSTVPARP